MTAVSAVAAPSGGLATIATAELTVVVPCRNEAGNVPATVERLGRALAGVAWEVVFVDDDSPDGTAAAAKAIAAGDSRVRCIRRVGRRGLASACLEGMLASAAPFVAVIDGDLQHDERLLPRMLAALRRGEAEVVVGSRRVPGGEDAGLSPMRRAVSEAGGALARAMLPVPLADPMSGFFALPRPLLEELAPRLTATGFKILLDVLLSADRPLRVLELPYAFRPRERGASKLDAGVLLEFVGLLVDKALGGRVPPRFVSFCAVGAVGVAVHLAVLALLNAGAGDASFARNQWGATAAAMTANFLLNNYVTYRDRKLRGAALARGLLLFCLVCGIGAAANVGVATLLVQDGVLAWGAAGVAGALITVVWNYAVSSTLVWGGAR